MMSEILNTPIFDFVSEYIKKEAVRLHMPGHKGEMLFGLEKYDITEIDGADSLFEADGIISESEKNASSLFGCNTFYSAEGSSLSIRAMLYLSLAGKKKPTVLAGRNAHRAFITASALLGFDVEWIYPQERESYLSCNVDGKAVENAISQMSFLPSAVYITSPDYLGNITDICDISRVCKKYEIPLLVDNAHGAYLRFLNPSLHPMDLGATMCCDSAHKTLPALTGGGYLHISKGAPEEFALYAKSALALFASTSPSYLILQSLDLTNRYLSDSYAEKLQKFVSSLSKEKSVLAEKGFSLLGNEPLKISINALEFGYSGMELSEILMEKNIFCEFADRRHLVMMTTPENKNITKAVDALIEIEKRSPIKEHLPIFSKPEKILSVREAVMGEKERLPIEKCKGRILALPVASCPPAVSVAVCGEALDEEIIGCMKYYGTKECFVVK